MNEYAVLYAHVAFFAEAVSNSWENRAASVFNVPIQCIRTGIHPNTQIVSVLVNDATQPQWHQHQKSVFWFQNIFWFLAPGPGQTRWYDNHQEDDSNKCSDARSNNLFLPALKFSVWLTCLIVSSQINCSKFQVSERKFTWTNLPLFFKI